MRSRLLAVLLTVLGGAPAGLPADAPPAPCAIEVVEKGSGWPVPLVELRTTHQVRLVTDNAGVAVCDLPELMGRETWFDVIGHGYGVPPDGFGYRGVRLTPAPGATLRVEVGRTLPARRLGRLTGAGLFAEAGRLGRGPFPPETGVLGCDSVQAVPYRGRHFWLWGDTTLAHYPLGIFNVSAATTDARPIPDPRPPVAVGYRHFRDARGRPRGVAAIPGEGPTWIFGCAVVPDRTGRERLVGTHSKIRPPLEAYEIGLCAWEDDAEEFRTVRTVWRKSDGPAAPPPVPDGNAVRWRDEAGRDWLLFGNPLPTLRCPATFEAWSDPATWEVLTPQADLPAAGTGRRVKPHSGAIAWNDFRRRWVTVFVEAFGEPSAFGEVWYAEADAPGGPWGPAVKVLTHENYTFYNPRLHPDLTPSGSPVLLFEGTYTRQFAREPAPTPRHDYNQILYRLDLDDPALRPAGADPGGKPPAGGPAPR